MSTGHRIYRIDVNAPCLQLHCEYCNDITEHVCEHGYWSRARRTRAPWSWVIVSHCSECGYRVAISLPVTNEGEMQLPML